MTFSQLYHGTPNGFFGDFDTTPAFFTDCRGAAEAYAIDQHARDDQPSRFPVVVTAVVTLDNPKVFTGAELAELLPGAGDGAIEWADFYNLAYSLEQAGHDGVIIRGAYDFLGVIQGEVKYGFYDQFVAFSTRQIAVTGLNAVAC